MVNLSDNKCCREHKFLITGATGFIGRNLCERLTVLFPNATLYRCSSKTSEKEIRKYTRDCTFVFNLAAVHRPKDERDFAEVNYEKFKQLLSLLRKNNNHCPVLYTSSIQADNASMYGISKSSAEEELRHHADMMSSRAIIYRLTNTFGKWGRPNGHSVVATFCYNIQRNIPIMISDPDHLMHFYYIDDVIDSFVDRINEREPDDSAFYELSKSLIYDVTLGELAEKLQSYKTNGLSFNCANEFDKKLYQTFISYSDEKQ